MHTNTTTRTTNTNKTPKTRSTMIAMVVAAILATMFLAVSPVSAKSTPVTLDYVSDENGQLRLTITFKQDETKQAATHFWAQLVPIGAGEAGPFQFIPGTGDVDHLYEWDMPAMDPGRYKLVLEDHHFGEVVTSEIPINLGSPVEALDGRAVEGTRHIALRWDAPIIEPATAYSITIPDISFVLNGHEIERSFVLDADTRELIVADLTLFDHTYPVTITTHYLWGTASATFFVKTSPDPQAPAPDPKGPTIDEADPTINLSVPGTVNRYSSSNIVTYSCADDVEVVSCSGTQESGTPVSTARIGTQTVSVTAIDAAGNTTTESANVTVDWAFTGRYAGVSGNEGIVARYYAATFGRLPDQSGFTFWVGRLTNDFDGAAAAAQFFATSPEFQALYGSNVSDTEFVDTIYVNVLGRTPEGAGRTFWIDSLANGTHTRGTVMSFFANSPEHMAVTGTS